MEKREILKTKIEEINYDIIQEFKDNPNIRTILYTERLYSFMRKKDLTLLPTKIINVILSAVKDEQQKYIKEASLPGIIVETPVRQMSFEDIFQDWAENTRARFTVNFKSIKLDKDIKNKELFEAFIYLSNLNWQIINDVETGDVELVPFIEAVKWNKNKQYIQFNMHKKTMESLLDMSKFLKLENDFVMNLKSAKTLSFIFWLSKFIPYNGTTISIQKFVEEMNLTSSYPSKIDEYLKRIRAEINSGNYAYGFNYSFENKNPYNTLPPFQNNNTFRLYFFPDEYLSNKICRYISIRIFEILFYNVWRCLFHWPFHQYDRLHNIIRGL